MHRSDGAPAASDGGPEPARARRVAELRAAWQRGELDRHLDRAGLERLALDLVRAGARFGDPR